MGAYIFSQTTCPSDLKILKVFVAAKRIYSLLVEAHKIVLLAFQIYHPVPLKNPHLEQVHQAETKTHIHVIHIIIFDNKRSIWQLSKLSNSK